MKDIEKFSYGTGTGKLLSDLFECGAISISNLVDKSQFDEREKRYKEVISGYRKDEQKKIVELFSKIYALLSYMECKVAAYKSR